ncbi:Tll0287-like domain-containing protein [Gelidibacter salicanalis]|uniref:DUF3365 domain-containing protein n=1 Tax=Gelidibacter salicanalis TaxID=291193 RepID=A0A934KW40_9FLAO|nr:DUF3365 domain-containing protein [Gelidibacter salicanalis]MBJ7881378.1 DUF3365 domain-containing protein [Gelidibacter salicanalis]
MKKAVLIVTVSVSFFSCNQEKKTNYISVENRLEKKTVPEKVQTTLAADTISYADRGLQYALNTQAVLGKNLMTAIQNSGTLGALSFCNEKAYPLTDSMAVLQNADLKRVTDKPRNPANQANTTELEHVETFKQVIANKELPNPIVEDIDGKVKVYYPILTNQMCLQCHGKPNKNIEPSTLSKLTILYPEDKAIGYGLNEVRGIWSVTFAKTKR